MLVHTKINGIKIAAISAAVSNDWESLADVMKRLNAEDETLLKKFQAIVGIKGRYNAGKYQTTSDFCYAAARKILEVKNIDPSEIGIIIFITQTPDYYEHPASACLLQYRLGISHDCIAFDVNLGCSGFTYGINIVSSLLKSSNADKALLLCGDTRSKERSQRIQTPASNSNRYLFGDAGTAALLVKDEAEEIHMLSKTDGSGYKAIITPYGGYRNPDPPEENLMLASEMDEIPVFTFATRDVTPSIIDTMNLNKFTPDDYDALVLHQANLFIMNRIAKKSGFPIEKMLVSIDEFGNTSSASIPVTLVKHYGDAESQKLHIMACGFGVGLSCSTADFYMDSVDILPLVHTDEFFDDGYKTIE